MIHWMPCRLPDILYIHLAFTYTVGPSSVLWNGTNLNFLSTCQKSTKFIVCISAIYSWKLGHSYITQYHLCANDGMGRGSRSTMLSSHIRYLAHTPPWAINSKSKYQTLTISSRHNIISYTLKYLVKLVQNMTSRLVWTLWRIVIYMKLAYTKSHATFFRVFFGLNWVW